MTLEELGLEKKSQDKTGLDQLHKLGLGFTKEKLLDEEAGVNTAEPRTAEDYSFIPTPEKKSQEYDFADVPLPPQKIKPSVRPNDPTEKVKEHFKEPASRYAKTVMGTDTAEMVFSDLANFGAIQKDTEEKLNIIQKSGAKFAGSSYNLLLESLIYASELAGRDDISQNLTEWKKKNLPLLQLPSSQKEFDLSDLTKVDFWAEQAPATIALYGLALAGGELGGAGFATAVSRLGWSPKAISVARFVGQIFGGTIPSTMSESFMEAAGTYNQAIDTLTQKGVPREQAVKKASEAAAATYTDNFAFLAGTNAFEYFTALGKLPRGLRNKFTRFVIDKAKGVGAGRGGRRAIFKTLGIAEKAAGAASEGWEELLQGWFQQTAQDYVEGNRPDAGLEVKDLLSRLEGMSPQVQSEILVGFGMGLLFQAGGSFDEYLQTRKKLEKQAKENPQQLKRDIESIINEDEETERSLNLPPSGPPEAPPPPSGPTGEQPPPSAPPEAPPAVTPEAPTIEPELKAPVEAPPETPPSAPPQAPAETKAETQTEKPKIEFMGWPLVKVDKMPKSNNIPQTVTVTEDEYKDITGKEIDLPFRTKIYFGEDGYNYIEIDGQAYRITPPSEIREETQQVQTEKPAEPEVETVEPEIVSEQEFESLGFAINAEKAKARAEGETKFNADDLDLSALDDDEVKALYRSMAVEMVIPKNTEPTDEQRNKLKDVFAERGMTLVDADITNAMNLRGMLEGSRGRGKFAKKIIDEVMSRPGLRRKKVEPKGLLSTQRALVKSKPNTYLVPVKSIQTDEDRFQLRKEPYNEDTVKQIEENYDPTKFEPIILWQDPEAGDRPYVLSGHSRLEGMKRRGERLIPATFFDGTEKEAMAVAAAESMANTPRSERKDAIVRPQEVKKPERKGKKLSKEDAKKLRTERDFVIPKSQEFRTPQEIDADILDRTLELEQAGATAEDIRNDRTLKELDEESKAAYAENERQLKEFQQQEGGKEEEPVDFGKLFGDAVDVENIPNDKLDIINSTLDYDKDKSDIRPTTAPDIEQLVETLKGKNQVEVVGRDGSSLLYAIKSLKVGDTGAGLYLEISSLLGNWSNQLGLNDVAGVQVGSPIEDLLELAKKYMTVQLSLFNDEKPDKPDAKEHGKEPSETKGTRGKAGKPGRTSTSGGRGVRTGVKTGGGELQAETPGGIGEEPTPERIEGGVGPVDTTTGEENNLPVFRIRSMTLDYGNTMSRFRDNLAALTVLHELRKTGSPPTPQQQMILSKYVGWGGLAQAAFDEQNQNNIIKYATEREQLKALLTPAELKAARGTTLNAHYTSYPVVRSMWRIMQRLGFNGGRVLEPGSGIGNFAGLVPDDLFNSTKMVGVEIDDISVEIARHLYPNSRFIHSGFQNANLNENSFDAVIGNVPFGNFSVYDPAIEKKVGKSLSIHNYFIYKAMTLLKPGGVMAVVTSRYTLDSQSNADFRTELNKIAAFVGAIRLPDATFKKNAATEVVTDMLFFRKRVGDASDAKIEQKFVDVMKTGFYGKKSREWKEYIVNEYIAQNKDMIYGFQTDTGKMQAKFQYNVEKADFNEATMETDLEGIAKSLPENIFNPITVKAEKVETTRLVELSLEDRTRSRQGSIIEHDGDVLVVTGFDVENNKAIVEPFTGSHADVEKARGIVGIKRAIFNIYDTQQSQIAPEEDVKRTTKELNTIYDAFVKKFGILHDKKNLRVFQLDPDSAHLFALENYDSDKNTATKTDIFSKRVIDREKFLKSASTPVDALAASMNESGRVNISRIANLLGVPEQEAVDKLEADNLIFKRPGAGYVTADEYLSGDVVTNLEVAIEAEKFDKSFTRNVEALRQVQPKPIPPDRIYVSAGAPWVPLDVYRDFFGYLMNTDVSKELKIARDQYNNKYYVRAPKWFFTRMNDTLRRVQWGTGRWPAEQVFVSVLNESYPTIRSDGEVDTEATSDARVKVDAMRSEFADWVMQDVERRERLAQIFNEKFNRTVRRDYANTGNVLTFQNMSPVWRDRLHQHQKDGIYRGIFSNTLHNVVVGGGKTAILVGTAMEAKRIGIAKKPIIVVKNNTLLQFRNDFMSIYPSAKVLVADDKNFVKAERQKFLARIATGDWDAIIITHSAFGFIPMSPDFQESFYQQVIDELVEAAMEAAQEEGRFSQSVKDIQKQIKKIEEKVKKLAAMRKDDLVTMEQLGIDMMLVDESHNFKNLFFTTKHRKILGLGSQGGGQKTFDMFMKAQYLTQINGGERGVIFATGTPVENSLAELYHILRYLSPLTMKQMGINNFDAFASTFAEAVGDVERKATGEYKLTTRFSKFKNLQQLSTVVAKFMNVKTIDDLPKIKALIPKHRGGGPQVASAPLVPEMDWYMQYLAARAKKFTGKRKKGEDNILVVGTDARKASLTLAMVAKGFVPNYKTKIDVCIENVFKHWQETKNDLATQLIFCDLGVPKKKKSKKKAGKKTAPEVEDESEDVEIDDLDGGFEADNAKVGIDSIGEAKRMIQKKHKNVDMRKVGEFFDQVLRMEKDDRYNIYEEIKSKLVKMGVPPDEIVFAQDFDSYEAKRQMQQKVREGKYRIVLASTSVFGEGTNVQARLLAEHQLDIPWTPAKMHQRVGRIARAGNMWLDKGGIYEYRYITIDSYDATMWQKIEQKAGFIDSFYKGDVNEMEDMMSATMLDASEMRAIATGNPMFKRWIELRVLIDKLEAEEKSHTRKIYTAESEVLNAPREMQVIRGKIAGYELAKELVDKTENNETYEMDGETFEKKTDLAIKIREAMTGDKLFALVYNNQGKYTELKKGSWKGIPFKIVGEYEGNQNGVRLRLKVDDLPNASDYSTEKFLDGAKEYWTPDKINALFRGWRNIERYIKNEKANLEQKNAAFESAKTLAQTKFKKATELSDAREEYSRVTQELNSSGELEDEDADNQMPEALRDDSVEAMTNVSQDELEDNDITEQDQYRVEVHSRCK